VTGSSRQPVRTCVGCGRRAEQRALVRLAADAGRVALGRRGGRGAWLHPAAACLERALGRRAFPRALRAPGITADVRVLEGELTEIARKV
jgi:predicted RNA-binding protein YlxR (DUF448 family)